MPWTKDQQAAIDKQNGNILVAASAGSGKTAVLVERIINKIIEQKVDIDKMLIVTFTKAAAAEMKERLLKAIYEKLDEFPDDQHLQKQLVNINTATITTIDSFFLEVVKSNFYECGLDPNVSIVDDLDRYTIEEEALNELIDEEFEKENNDEFEILYEMIADGNEKDFKKIIKNIYDYIQSFPYPYIWLKKQIEEYNIVSDGNKKILNVFADYVKEKIKMLEKNYDIAIEISSYDDTLNSKYVPFFEKEKGDLIYVRNATTYNELYERLNNNIVYDRMPTIRGGDYDEEGKKNASDIRGKIKKETPKLKNLIYAEEKVIIEDLKSTYEYLVYLYEFIVKLNDKLLEKKKEKNVLAFADVSHIALDLLLNRKEDKFGNEILEETEVAKKYKEKFEEIYIDEYQDSNYVQEYVLSAVSRKSENKPNQFMVGDIKQSIYGFRQAMPEIFLEKYETYSKDLEDNYTKIILSKNFRSRAEVLNPINYIFGKIMTKECGKCSYVGDERLSVGASYENDETSDYSMEVNVLDLIDNTEDIENGYVKFEDAKLEGINIAKRINEIVNGDIEKNIVPLNVYDVKSKSENKFRKAEYKDIVILIRSGIGTRGKVIEEELKKYNIPVFCDNSSSIFEKEEVNFIMSFLGLLDNWYQDVPLAAVMYSIIGKFTLNEILKIRRNYKEGYLYDALINSEGLDTDLVEKIEKFLELIYKYKEMSKYFKISELLISLYEETEIYEQFLLKEGGIQKCANLDALVDVAASFETAEYKGLYHFMEYVKNAKETKQTGTDPKIIGETENVVRIMTIHKSKGLEFPIVFLAMTSSEFNKKDINTNEIILDNELGIGVNVIKKQEDFLHSYPSIIKNLIKERKTRELISEEIRLLYVALTRAKEKLIITGTKKNFNQFLKNQFIIFDEEQNVIDKNCIFSLNCYFDIIMLTLKDYVFNEDCKININAEKVLRYQASDEKEINDKSVLVEWENYVEKISMTEEEEEELLKILNYTYGYTDAINMKEKYTVSELKKKNHIDEEDMTVSLDKKINLEKMYKVPLAVPTFMLDDIQYNGSQIGTLLHKVLENLDFKTAKKENLKEFVQSLVDRKIIHKEEVKYIYISSLEKYMDSEIFKLAKNSNMVEKEKPFVYKKAAKDIIDTNIEEKVLIQGIIDMYFELPNGNICLVDYKTDRILNDQEFIDRYKVQLGLYKEALEHITGKTVEKVFIYSLYNSKSIEIK